MKLSARGISLCVLVLAISFGGHCQSTNGYEERLFFKAKFEPEDHVFSGAGQSPEAFEHYVNNLEDAKPVIYMTYVGLKNRNLREWVEKKDHDIKQYPWQIVPQIGLSMTSDGNPEQHYENKVAAGEYDEQIEALCLALKDWEVPIFLRIGYEFNGQWNGYEPETYKKAFVRVVEALRRNKAENVAVVWCFATDGQAAFMPFYPGDDYVDWWAIDLFAETHFKDPKTTSFLDSALLYKKPVMIGESTPRRVGVQDGEESWERWFAPYFELIRSSPHIKAFSYINRDWAAYPQWSDWGDGRIETNEVVLRKFREEMDKPLYMHGDDKRALKKIFKCNQ